MRKTPPNSVFSSNQGGGRLRRRPVYAPETALMRKKGIDRGFDFTDPERYASSERRWIKFQSVFLECLLLGGSKIQHKRRIPMFVWNWSHLLAKIESQEVKNRISSFIQSLLEMGGPKYLKNMFRGVI